MNSASWDERDHHIAIIGLAGRFPGASGVEQFWANLRDGVESITFPSDQELIDAGVPAETLARRGYVRAVASASDVENFDAAFFGYTPREAANSDPQIRMFLEVSHAALEHAGYDPYGVPGSVGVYASGGINRYVDMHLQYGGAASSSGSMALGSLNNMDYLAITVSYKLNLRGPSIFVASACSSSLVAVHMASQALRNGECDVALAGGVDVEFPVGHGYQWDEGGPVSVDGHVRPFDVGANGTVFGTGAGAVVLKRLSSALEDGDTIHAVIRGSAVNNDGAAKAGMASPSAAGQAEMLVEAMAVARVDPRDISYVETHATGTPLGDPIEVSALARAFRHAAGGDLPAGSCPIGSVKANVGHLGHAAGVTSLIKVVLSLSHEQLPPSVNFTEPNPQLGLPETPFYVNDQLNAWPRNEGRPRIAGVSSFGVGGTNCHVIIEEAPLAPVPRPVPRRQVVVWSAKNEDAELAYRDTLAGALGSLDPALFPAAAATLQDGRRGYPIRRAVIAEDAAELAVQMNQGDVLAGSCARRRIVFAYPGQGAQQPRMAAGLYGVEPVFTGALDRVFDLFAAEGVQLREAWLAVDRGEIDDTRIAQPLLFSVAYALTEMLAAWGITPDAVLGHSLGELTAGAVAGVMPLPDAVRLVVARAAAMADTRAGGMLAVALSAAELRPLLSEGMHVAVINGARQTVLSGTVAELDAFAVVLRDRRIAARPLRTSGAFHSPLMAEAAARFEKAFDDVRLAAPKTAFYSAAAGGLVTEEAADPAFWANQLTEPVRFAPAAAGLFAGEPCLVLEVGAGDTLTRLCAEHGPVRDGVSEVVGVLPARPAGDDHRQALSALARIWTEGHPVDWNAVRQGEPIRRVSLPGYRYQRARHWVDAPEAAAATPLVTVVAEPATAEISPLSTLTWVEEPPAAAAEPDAEVFALMLLPAEANLTRVLVPAAAEAGLRAVLARPGESYAEVAGEFRFRPGSQDDLAAIMRALAERGRTPQVVVHALANQPFAEITGDNLDTQVQTAFGSLVALVKEAARWPSGGRQPALIVLTSGSVDVTGAEPLDPVKAMQHGFLRSLVQEAASLGGRLIDVAAGTPANALAAELRRWAGPDVVALRGSRRWVRREIGCPVPTGFGPVVRRNGVYLITGGLGGLGQAVARGLAETGRCPRLVLLGRTGAPDAATGGRGAAILAELAQLETLGCEVRVIAADVSDRRALRRALDTVAVRFGALHGVFHLAGVPGDGMVQFRDPADIARVLAPKVAGTVHLAEALAERPPLDLFVSFSSRAAIDGLAGSADYAAANAFQDAYTAVLRRREVPALSINWPSWARVGMAAEYVGRGSGRRPEPGAAGRFECTLGPDNCPLLDEHRVDDVPVMPGTGHIDLVIRAFRATVLDGAASPVRLWDVVFNRIMAAPAPRRVQALFDRDGERWRFEVQSAAVDAPDDAMVHARGYIASADAAPGFVDLAELRDRYREPLVLDGDEPHRVFTLGPRWHNVISSAVTPGGDGTDKVVELGLAEEFTDEVTGYALHPTLLDSATSEARRPDEEPHLPFVYQSLLVNGDLPARFFSHIQRRPAAAPGLIVADVTVIGPDGAVLLEIGGYTMCKASLRSMAAGEMSGGAAVVDTAVAAAPDGIGIEPEAANRLIHALLASTTPGQVAVRPHRDGRPLPLTGAPVDTPLAQGVPKDAGGVSAPPRTPLTPSAVPKTRIAGQSGADSPGDDGAGDSVQQWLTQLWLDAFGHASIGLDEDFFDLGGNSLAAVELMGRIREKIGVDLSIAALFDFPTIRSLAEALRGQGAR